jgi:hypothetical protein
MLMMKKRKMRIRIIQTLLALEVILDLNKHSKEEE